MHVVRRNPQQSRTLGPQRKCDCEKCGPAARLAELYGIDLQVPTNDPVLHYRSQVIDLVRRTGELDRPVLLVIDGADEAAGWQIDGPVLPHEPNQKLRIVVSARLQRGDR